jgi:hypothetical protein
MCQFQDTIVYFRVNPRTGVRLIYRCAVTLQKMVLVVEQFHWLVSQSSIHQSRLMIPSLLTPLGQLGYSSLSQT